MSDGTFILDLARKCGGRTATDGRRRIMIENWHRPDELVGRAGLHAPRLSIPHHNSKDAEDVEILLRRHAPASSRGKRIARLRLEDVTIRKTDKLLAQVRFKGGTSRA